MSADKRWRLICYDIREPKRYRKAFKILRGVGHSIQYSIFRARLDDREAERLRWQLSRVLHPDDALLVIDLCPRCASNVVTRNHVEGWAEKVPTFRIVGQACDHVPDGVDDELSLAEGNLSDSNEKMPE